MDMRVNTLAIRKNHGAIRLNDVYIKNSEKNKLWPKTAQRIFLRGDTMKTFIIGVLCTVSLSVSAMPIPEKPELVFAKSSGVYNTPLRLKHYDDIRKAKMYWYAINALDVYTTYNGLRQNGNLYEANPILPKRPSVSQLAVHKIVLITVFNRYLDFTQRDYRKLNTILTGVVINNYSLYN